MSDRCNVFSSEAYFSMTSFQKKKNLFAYLTQNILVWTTACRILTLNFPGCFFFGWIISDIEPYHATSVFPHHDTVRCIFIIPHESWGDCLFWTDSVICSPCTVSLMQLLYVYGRSQWKRDACDLVWICSHCGWVTADQLAAHIRTWRHSGATKDTYENGGPKFNGLHQILSTP